MRLTIANEVSDKTPELSIAAAAIIGIVLNQTYDKKLRSRSCFQISEIEGFQIENTRFSDATE